MSVGRERRPAKHRLSVLAIGPELESYASAVIALRHRFEQSRFRAYIKMIEYHIRSCQLYANDSIQWVGLQVRDLVPLGNRGWSRSRALADRLASCRNGEIMNENRAAIVVGGTGGIGSATCRRLAGEGDPVAVAVAVAEYNLEGGQAVARGRLPSHPGERHRWLTHALTNARGGQLHCTGLRA